LTEGPLLPSAPHIGGALGGSDTLALAGRDARDEVWMYEPCRRGRPT